MAKLASITALILAIMCLLAYVDASKQGCVAEEEINFIRDSFPGEETANLEFYVHFLNLDHPNPTSYEVARANITKYSPTSFGLVAVQDRLVTVDPDPCSKQLGRFQGMTINSDFLQDAIVVNDVMYFTSGKYAGSTLTFHGRVQMNSETKELVVSGGTGTLRYAHGYSTLTTVVRGENFDIVRFVVYVVFTDKCIPSDNIWISRK